jgi:hypothetical protein
MTMTTIPNPKELITNKIFDRDEMQFVLFVDDRQGKKMRLFSLRFRLSHDSSEREREDSSENPLCSSFLSRTKEVAAARSRSLSLDMPFYGNEGTHPLPGY